MKTLTHEQYRHFFTLKSASLDGCHRVSVKFIGFK